MNKKSVRKPRSILIDPDAVHEALRSKKTLGEWHEETINEKIKRRKDLWRQVFLK